MGRSAKAVKTDLLAFARHAIGTPADQAGTQQRRSLRIGKAAGKGKAVARLGNGMGGIAAIAGCAGEAGKIAEVFMSLTAIGTGPTTMTKPGNADTIANVECINACAQGHHPSNNFMARYDRIMRRNFSINDMQVGAIYPAGANVHQQLALCRDRNLPNHRLQGHGGP
jgi:hypothetical protein